MTIIFIDDLRNPKMYLDLNTNDVYHAYNYQHFVNVLNNLYESDKKIDEIWFDHDLGDDTYSGYDCAKYLVKFCVEHNIKLPKYHIHSANPVGRENIDSYLKSYLKSLSL